MTERSAPGPHDSEQGYSVHVILFSAERQAVRSKATPSIDSEGQCLESKMSTLRVPNGRGYEVINPDSDGPNQRVRLCGINVFWGNLSNDLTTAAASTLRGTKTKLFLDAGWRGVGAAWGSHGRWRKIKCI